MKFPYGKILPEIPKEYFPPEMWPEYGYLADPAPWCRRVQLRENPVAIRWSLWPLCFEQYVGDEIPRIDISNSADLAYNRIALWRRLHDGPTPAGWRRGWDVWRVDGYKRLPESDLTRDWNKNARRDLRLWQEKFLNKTHSIEEISIEEFSDAFKKSLVAKREGTDRLTALQRKLQIPLAKRHTSLWGVREKNSGSIVAGTAAMFSPSYKVSTHVAPFIHAEARSIFAATALVHHWHEESRKRGCPVVMTINFWYPGQPKSWKGFSEFKSHFGYEYVKYPPVLWRFVGGKFL